MNNAVDEVSIIRILRNFRNIPIIIEIDEICRCVCVCIPNMAWKMTLWILPSSLAIFARVT